MKNMFLVFLGLFSMGLVSAQAEESAPKGVTIKGGTNVIGRFVNGLAHVAPVESETGEYGCVMLHKEVEMGAVSVDISEDHVLDTSHGTCIYNIPGLILLGRVSPAGEYERFDFQTFSYVKEAKAQRKRRNAGRIRITVPSVPTGDGGFHTAPIQSEAGEVYCPPENMSDFVFKFKGVKGIDNSFGFVCSYDGNLMLKGRYHNDGRFEEWSYEYSDYITEESGS